MQAIQITDTKEFMRQLLGSDTFDSFLLQEGEVVTATKTYVDGFLNLDFYPEEERTKEFHPYEFWSWSEARGLFFSLIKGTRTPLSFRFTLQLKPDTAQGMLLKGFPEGDFSSVRALLINIKYNGKEAQVTTGTSYTTFLMDHTADQLWDRALLQFLSGHGISFELL